MDKKVFVKWIILVFIFALVIGTCGCGKSEDAKKVDEEILTIGEVNESSDYILDKIEADISCLDEEELESLDNLQMFYDAQEAYNSLMANAVISLINDIGEVTRKKGDKIEEASQAYNKLDLEQKKQVTNYNILIKAKKEYKKKQNEYITKKGRPALNSLTKDYDKVQDVTWYTHLPQYADIRSYMLPYIGDCGANDKRLFIRYNYTGGDWVFWEEILFLVDGERFSMTWDYNDVVRDHNGYRVREYLDEIASEDDIETLKQIANSKETVVRFQGDDNKSSDFTVSAADKRTIKTVLDAFEYIKIK